MDKNMDDFENMSEFSPFTWQPVYSDGTQGEVIDFNIAIDQQSHLSSSRGILETIVEETSDDEENGVYAKWSGSDSFSSGSSQTGSVVHVDTQNDQDNQDAMSERDFICPPKRRKQEVDQSKLDFIPTSSLFSQLLNVPNASAVHNENGLFESYFLKQSDLRYRFDELGVELFSDSDRLSFTSLSRSSSLIQFESLERQLQQSDSQISGSSPSIYSYEGASGTSTSGNAHQEINNSEKLSAPIAINLPTIKAIASNPPLPLPSVVVTASVVQFTNSDSEPFSSGGSSSSGSFSSDDSELHVIADKKQQIVNDSSLSSTSSSSEDGKVSNSAIVVVGMIKANENRRKHSSSIFRAKNSVDSLSEDSGYCDRDTRRGGTLSLDSSLTPTGNDLEDEDGSVIEEKSIQQMRLLPRIRSHSDEDDVSYHSMENLNRRIKSRKIDLLSEINIEDSLRATPQSLRGVKIDTTSAERGTMVKNKMENSRRSPEFETHEKFISISSPELYASGDNSRTNDRSNLKRNYRKFRDFNAVSSVPEHLNLLASDREEYCEFSTNSHADSVASKNFNLFDLNYGQTSGNSASKKCVDISASCANLTLLNYSDDPTVDFCYDSPQKLMPISRSKIQTSTMSGKLPTRFPSSDDEEDDFISSYHSKELSSLLEEISAHFNKNLSILNDREASYEPQTDVRDTTMEVKSLDRTNSPPKPPPRARTQIKTSPNHSAVKQKATFDQDPTNLTTTYAQSLEKCNFNVDEPVNVYNSRQNIYLTVENEPIKNNEDLPKAVHKRNFVSSTPNLNYFDFDMRHVHHYSSIDNNTIENDRLSPSFNVNHHDENRSTSMKEIPTANSRASSTGILASSTGGSKSHLSVSFCPIVSEISWQHPDDDDFSDDVDMDPSAGEDYSAARNDSLINYYEDENVDDDDDSEEDFDDFRAVGISTNTAMPVTTTNVKIQVNDDDQTQSQLHKYSQNEHINDDNTHAAIIKTSTPPDDVACNIVEPKVIETLSDRQQSQQVSHKMLVETQTPSEKLISAECLQSAAIMDANKMQTQSMTTVPQKVVSVSEKSKNKKSIFSRLSSGFRFSFRGKKNKKSIKSDGIVHYPVETNNNGDALKQQQINVTVVDKRSQKNGTKSTDTGDFVYIPLTDPNDNVRIINSHGDKLAADLHQKLLNDNSMESQSEQSSVERQSRSMQPQKRESPPRGGPMGKPPLPKQPPRIVGTTTKRPSAQAPRASSTPREYDNGEFFNQSMIGDGLKQQYYSERARTMDGGSSGHKIGLIETNLDTDETIINGKTQSLMELGIGQNTSEIMSRMSGMGGVKVMQNDNSGKSERRPHKSMEFLLDKENHQRVLPPENELQKARESNVTLSEHQLRVQASLQKLNIPDWYKQYSATGHNNSSYCQQQKGTPDVSGILRKRNSDIGRWQGLNSKTTSLSSLGSNRSDRSPVMLSPSAHSHTGGQSGFSRWSTSHLNSSQTSPSVSARSSFVRNTNTYSSTMSGQSVVSSTASQSSEIRNSFRKPYLGWRSQEKLNQPRTAHERLASSLMSQRDAQQPIATPEIQSSIKEVTSAIVHYVNDQNRGSRSRSVSPSTRCWLESSFVGTKPLESPQTPALENQFASSHKTINIGPMSVTATNYDSIRLNGIGGGESSVI